MEQNKLYHYGEKDGKRGLEATYMLIGATLHIKIPGTNHWLDASADILAWPRKRIQPAFYQGPPIKHHMAWDRMAERFFLALVCNGLFKNGIDEVKIISFSMGGPISLYLAKKFPISWWKEVTTINAPKMGNRAAVRETEIYNIFLRTMYDEGDIIRRLPLLYAGYPDGTKRAYACTKGLGKAHNNKPKEWGEFPI